MVGAAGLGLGGRHLEPDKYRRGLEVVGAAGLGLGGRHLETDKYRRD